MFAFVGKQPLKKNSADVVEKWLTIDPARRVVLALLDLYNMLEEKTEKLNKHYESNNSMSGDQSDLNSANQQIIAQQCCHEAYAELMLIKNSLIWKLSAPLRNWCDRLRRLFQ